MKLFDIIVLSDVSLLFGITIPTLMIWGEQDTALGKELTYGTEQYVRHLQIRYIPDTSHWVQQEKPDLVNQFMQEFLSQ
jgi:pimeloyl-ACP methyl ester carboxylesterase